MSHTFRLYKGGADNLEGWSASQTFPYNSTARDTIEDTNGASAKHEITSIPSPYARIDLVKTAFKEICQRKELEGDTIFHKMVSDSLDVGEIFFNLDKFKDKVEIIVCDLNKIIDSLKNDGNQSHLYIADSLEKYKNSDAGTYNFNELKSVYLLNYSDGPDKLNIIGATSPATIFFSNANKLDYVNGIFFANNQTPFESKFTPLYKRDPEYIKAWFTLRKTMPEFSKSFQEINDYLDLTFKSINDQNLKNQLRNITQADVNNFDYIDVNYNNQNNEVEVLGTPLFKRLACQNVQSDFVITPDYKREGELPFVLPVESGNKYANLDYTNGKWGTSNKAPYKSDVDDVSKRILPSDGTQHPYLCISDFLEDKIIRVPHSMNHVRFFDGMNEDPVKMSYLLPIKPLYFEFFSTDTLCSKLSDGKSAFEMQTLAGDSIKVTIRIPIKGDGRINYIEYERKYYNDRPCDVSDNSNDGGIINFAFAGMIMPDKKFSNENDALYTVACISTFSSKYKLYFYNKGDILQDIPVDCRNKAGEFVFKAETYTIRRKNFDVIRITDDKEQSNVIVPVLPLHQGIYDFNFSVDLGTSNTHIEFQKSGDNTSLPFFYDNVNKSDEPMFCTFFKQSQRNIDGKLVQLDLTDEHSLITRDFLPMEMGKDSDYHFPTRTALSCAKIIDWNTQQRAYGMLNMDITYDKNEGIAYNDKPMVNIKWSNEPNAQAAMNAYIDNIMIMIRNKVIADNGKLSGTKITWFYPSSMSHRRLSQLQQAWNNSYKEYFNANGAATKLSESEAPIQYYFRRYSTATNLVNVDIGGGTTDIAFSSGGHVDYTTSFKFASNSLFEDALSTINPNNGIVNWFGPEMLDLLESNKFNELVNIYHKNVGHPADMASFLFSLKDNSKTKGLTQNTIDFNRILQNDTKFKIVFIIFYTAIIYHIAQIVRVKGIKLPRHIAFSGNGSKVLNILTNDAGLLAKYTKKVFEGVLGKPYDSALDILGLEQSSNPKEATCKGGLIATTSYEKEPETLILMDSSGKLANRNDIYASISDEQKKEIAKSVERFFKFTLEEIPNKINLDDYFGVDNTAINIAKNMYKMDLETYIDKGIELSIKESGNPDNQVEDAPAFYAIKGVLQSLSDKIYEYYRQKP